MALTNSALSKPSNLDIDIASISKDVNELSAAYRANKDRLTLLGQRYAALPPGPRLMRQFFVLSSAFDYEGSIVAESVSYMTCCQIKNILDDVQSNIFVSRNESSSESWSDTSSEASSEASSQGLPTLVLAETTLGAAGFMNAALDGQISYLERAFRELDAYAEEHRANEVTCVMPSQREASEYESKVVSYKDDIYKDDIFVR